jgi:alpha-beta hydrolase superfamily lysophospholipase
LARVAAASLAAIGLFAVGLQGTRQIHGWFAYDRAVAISADSVQSPTISGQQALIAYNHRTGPRQLLLFFHGYGADHQALATARRQHFAQSLVDEGWIVAATNASGNDWGSRRSQEDYLALYRAVEAQHEIGEVVMLSESMGAVASLNIAASGDIPGVVRWIGISPVVDLGSAAHVGPLTKVIPQAQVTAVDPSRLAPGLLAAVPKHVFTDEADTVVATSRTRVWAARYGADLRTCDGGHVGKPCYEAALAQLLAE